MTTATLLPFEVEIALPVKTYDIDFAGVVSNIVYVRWLEDLRLEVLAQHFPLNRLLDNGIAPVIVQTKIDYKQAIDISESPRGRMWIKTMEAVRWTVSAEIVVNQRISAIAEQIGIFVDLQNKRPVRIPEALKQKYEQFM